MILIVPPEALEPGGYHLLNFNSRFCVNLDQSGAHVDEFSDGYHPTFHLDAILLMSKKTAYDLMNRKEWGRAIDVFDVVLRFSPTDKEARDKTVPKHR